MNIDVERLKRDRAYWDEVAPEGATHYRIETRSRYAGWMKSDGVGNWKLAFDKNDDWGSDDSPGDEAIPRPEPATEWDDFTAPDWATHYCSAHKAWRNSTIDVIADCCIPLPKRSTAWDGGLPPVGERCLGKHKEFNSNFECVINGYRDGKVWFTDFMDTSEREFVYPLSQVELRPIRTKEQRDREDLLSVIPHPGFSTKQDIADAILAAGWQKPE